MTNSLHSPIRSSAPALVQPIVLMLLADGDRSCGTFGLPVAASTLSHHFRSLRKAGVLHQYDRGRPRMNTLRLDELDHRFPGVVRTVLDAANRAADGLPAAAGPAPAARPARDDDLDEVD